MAKTTLKNALDGARAVEFDESGAKFVVWHGGTTFNVYHTTHDAGFVRELTMFSVSDDEGYALDDEAARDRIDEYLDRDGD